MPEPARRKQAAGRLIAVVGPSGVGKDSLIAYARARLGQTEILFIRRAITRPGNAGGEAHLAMTQAEFDNATGNGDFAVTWRAHDLCYGVPRSVLEHVEKGGVAVLNASRAALRDIERVFGNVLVVSVTASNAALAARLAGRGRESEPAIAARLSREVPALPCDCEVIHLDNSSKLEQAGARLVGLLSELKQVT